MKRKEKLFPISLYELHRRMATHKMAAIHSYSLLWDV